MNKKRLLQTFVFVLFIVGAAYVLSTSIGSARAEQEVLENSQAEKNGETGLLLPAKVTKDGLTVEVLDYRWEENEARFDVKFSLVDSRDWQIRKAYIEVEGKRYSLWGTTLVEMVSPAIEREQTILRYKNGVVEETAIADTGDAYRIDTLAFGDAPSDLDKTSFMLVIQEISTMPDEGEYCNPGIQKSIQDSMEEKYPGIEIECISEPGYLGYQIVPDSKYLTNAEIMTTFDAAVNQALFTILVGPWNFSFEN